MPADPLTVRRCGSPASMATSIRAITHRREAPHGIHRFG
ncbi:MAG: hypothetical protein AVDCRST_MAG90-3254 [uncultured Microvirga sp.]|uniref:Uncharacterized protein n=1 Tax=uncultured Microvirga sp. TaxID=412392 RepID=A0A6J4MJV7_9HYPH|nr:MAG: hypothetical protein AVDCRST_MAG90-3254 [uncultured Microvirga sp.]